MGTVQSLIERLSSTYKPDDHIATAIWCEADVIGRAKERGRRVTRQQAQRILDTIERKQDCEIGIRWLTLDVYTDAELGL